jgi:hypothetical protein
MPQSLSHRATTAVFVGVAAAVVAILLSFVWPGFLVPTNCAQSRGPYESFGGHSYCALALAPFQGHLNKTFWGYGFQLFSWFPPGGPTLQVTVTEPNGTDFAGGLFLCGACNPNQGPTLWLTPDLRAGITTNWTSGNTSLLVEK